MAEKVVDLKTCYHCGEPCEEEIINFEDHEFCCAGCQMVYEILAANDMHDYYKLQSSPGASQRKNGFADKYAFLDVGAIADRLLQFKSASVNKITFSIPVIHCSSCIWLLENLSRLKDGIVHSRVNFVKKEATVDFEPAKISLRELTELLVSIGYEPEINLDSDSDKKTRGTSRAIFLKMGVAGFAFGNIMLLSFPEYFGIDGLDKEVKQFFLYLSLVLSIPVVFYCASDYYLSAIKGLRQKFINIDVPITIGVAALFARSLFEIFSETGSGYLDSLAGLIFFLLIGKWFQGKTYEGLSFDRDYKSYFPLAITRITEKGNESVPVTGLRKGDKILVRNQEIIPADSVLLDEMANIDYSFVTGEADPVAKSKSDYLYAGGRQIGESIKLVVEKETSQSYLTQLWNQDFLNDSKIETDALIDKISRYFTIAVLLIASTAGIFWLTHDSSKALNAFTAVLIVACPCALALATPFTIGSALAVFGKRKFYLKNAAVIEKLATVTTVVFDKTGTLTDSHKTKVEFEGNLTHELESAIKTLVANSMHPISRKIGSLYNSKSQTEISNYQEFEGKGIQAVFKNEVLKLGSADFLNVSKVDASGAHVSSAGKYLGFFRITQSYRTGLKNLIEKLILFKHVVLSGDNDSERGTLRTFFANEPEMVFDQTPDDKRFHVKNLQLGGERVMMLGDGLNDAGALAQSNVGIAVTDDTTSFSPACDGILEGSALPLLDSFLALSKSTRWIIKASFIISFLYNIVGLSFAVSGNLTPVFAAVLMPLSSITVVTFATFAVQVMAKAKGLR